MSKQAKSVLVSVSQARAYVARKGRANLPGMVAVSKQEQTLQDLREWDSAENILAALRK